MQSFLDAWARSTLTTLGFFWMALWAFILGYTISGMIQVFVTRERMKRTMGEADTGSVALATFFGFISSSCSFAAFASAKALFKKGAGLIPSLAFLLASTNLVIELGIVIAVFLSWQFVVGEYVGGILLILVMWLIVRLTYPEEMIVSARRRLREEEGEETGEVPDWRERVFSLDGWRRVAKRYFMEWKMVWKDVTFGLNVVFLGVTAGFAWLAFGPKRGGNQEHEDDSGHGGHHHGGGRDWMQGFLTILATASLIWLAGGVLHWLVG